MGDAAWDRMWTLFHAARALPADRRPAFLEAECGGDETLRREVIELLASDEQAGGPLDRGPADGAAPPVDGLAGRRVGAYVIRERIGEGGMGAVYDAEQEAPVRRRVALKVIHAGVHPDAAARFALERQALALMSHPHIARVFDAGTTPDGRPFIAMEHVAGVPLNEYCDRHALDVGQRLDLFVTVCQAVQHAHQKGVIHRDLKPSNVLVAIEDGRPMPKVIDFGVAKALHPAVDGEGLRTREEVLVGTLEYMSPEQLDPTGLDVDTRSDIYSLGVVLYELLAGTLPFDWPSLRQRGFAALRARARESEAPLASGRFHELAPERAAAIAARRRTTPAALHRRLRGDLDWILRRALDRDRTRRYATASELALDVRRHLAHEPVQAGPPSTAYRLAKFVRRHRASVATVAAAVLLLAAFAVGTVLQAREVRRALERADRERARAERVSRFVLEVFRASDPFEGGREATAREVLDRGAGRVTRELAGEPDVQAAVMSAIGRVYSKLNLFEDAERLLRNALALHRRTHGGEAVEVAETLEELGEVLRLKADYRAAAALLEEAAGLRRRLHGEEDPRRARSLYLLGTVRRLEGDLAAAEARLGEALIASRAGAGPGDASLFDVAVTAATLEELGAVANRKGDFAAAEARLREALGLRRREQGRDAPRTAATLGRLGGLLMERGDLEAAEPLLREALDLLERHLGGDHSGLAPPLNNLALLLQNRGDYDAAEPLYRRSLAISRALHGDGHPSVAGNLNNLGLLLHDQGRFDEAAGLFREALAIQARTLGARHADVAYPTTNLARVLHDQGRFAQAESLYRTGLGLRREALPAGHPALGDSLAWLGKLLTDRGQPQGAEPLLREAVAVRAGAFTSEDWRTAEARSLLGGCLAAQRRYAEAEPLLVESYPILEQRRGREYRRTREARGRVAALYEAWGRPAEAVRYRD